MRTKSRVHFVHRFKVKHTSDSQRSLHSASSSSGIFGARPYFPGLPGNRRRGAAPILGIVELLLIKAMSLLCWLDSEDKLGTNGTQRQAQRICPRSRTVRADRFPVCQLESGASELGPVTAGCEVMHEGNAYRG